VLRFTGLELSRVKIIILGQDPYPQAGAATGRAFEVGTLESWQTPFRNTSLKNIVRALYQYYTGSTKKYLEILPEIGKTFPLPSPQNLFAIWEEQGVLLLNTSLTCALGKPGSHAALWSDFTTLLVEFLSQRLPRALWILWGNHAQRQLAPFPSVHTLRSRHPMLCAPGHPADFLFGEQNCFRETKNLINWLG
jgi:uracil-DNA glycosylase